MARSESLLDGVRRVHLVGIGGIGVSAVARLLRAWGVDVQGSDAKESSITQALRGEGMVVYIGHDRRHVRDVDLVVHSAAIPSHNVEIQAAKRAGIPVVHRAMVLAAIMARFQQSVGVTGTNGKGTVAAMITHVLRHAGLRPSFAVGAICHNLGTNAARDGDGVIVCELDESDGSFAWTRPTRLVINNLEADHLNYYEDLDGVLRAFREYVRHVPSVLHVNASDPNCLAVSQDSIGQVVTFGESPGADYRAQEVEQQGKVVRFRLTMPSMDLGWFELPLPGTYQAMNAAAALSVALEMGVHPDVAREGLSMFKGLKNRFAMEHAAGVTLVKDYMSHPTGIRCVLEAARGLGHDRVLAVFKPYRYTMVNYLHGEYRAAFRQADRVVVTELFAAGEDPIPGVNAQFLAERIRLGGTEVDYVQDLAQIPGFLHELVSRGDCVVFFGGDDLFEQADRFRDMLEKKGW